MIVERAARSRLIAEELREIAARLDSNEDHGYSAVAIKTEAEALRTLARQVERL